MRGPTLSRLTCCLVGGAMLLGAGAARAAEGKLEIPYERYTLDNGLEVLLHQDKRLPLVAVDVWYHVAAFHEPAERTGFAHLFEHMMFQGSAHVGDDKHFAILKGIGASSINGTTSFDRTNYFETVPSNQLETALWLESDRMGFLLQTLTQEKLDNQRGVVQNERRQGVETQPYGIAEEKMWQALFPQPHPYYGMVIGSMDHLGAASLEDVRSFFRTWYAPSNATVAVAGDFELDQAKQLIEKYFGSLPKAPKPTPPVVKPVALSQEVTLRHDEQVATLAKVMVGWHTPAFFAEGDATADILAATLSSGKASRLHKRLVRELQIAQSVSAYQQSMGAQSVFQIEVTARPGVDPKQLLLEVDAALAKLAEGDVSEAEVKRALNRYETGFFKQLQQLGGFGGRADTLQVYNHFLGDPGYLAKDVARYRAVTPAMVTAFVKDYLAKDRRVVMIAEPPAPEAAPGEAPAGKLKGGK